MSDHIQSIAYSQGRSAVDIDDFLTRDLVSMPWPKDLCTNSMMSPHDVSWQNDRSWVSFRSFLECAAISNSTLGYAVAAWEKRYIPLYRGRDSSQPRDEFVHERPANDWG